MSYLSPLSSCSTPGWNDPPPVLGFRKTASTGALANRHRRPVHPSIQASSNSPVVYSNSAQPNFTSPPQAAVPALVSAQVPALASAQQSFVPYSSISAQAPNYAPMDSFIPYTATSSSTGAPSNRSYDEKSSLAQQHRSIFDAFTVPGPQQQVQRDETSAAAGLSYQRAEEKYPRIPLQRSGDSPILTRMHTVPPIETNPEALIYTPPNVIGEINNKRPATSPYPVDFVAPVKAAGDVSLSGLQLVQFLIKATYRLPAGVTRDGIQLRINQLNELISSGQVTDSCIKKLNFVVDALDRGLFDEAYQFFEQLQASFPTETRTSWAQGIRLLLNELRRPTRAASAGPARHI